MKRVLLACGLVLVGWVLHAATGYRAVQVNFNIGAICPEYGGPCHPDTTPNSTIEAEIQAALAPISHGQPINVTISGS